MEDWIDMIVLTLHRTKTTQEKFALQCGCSRESVNKIINGNQLASEKMKQAMIATAQYLCNKT